MEVNQRNLNWQDGDRAQVFFIFIFFDAVLWNSEARLVTISTVTEQTHICLYDASQQLYLRQRRELGGYFRQISRMHTLYLSNGFFFECKN